MLEALRSGGRTDKNQFTVFLHGHCADGICAAHAIRACMPAESRPARFGRMNARDSYVQPDAVFLEMFDRKILPPKNTYAGRHVMFIDIVPEGAVLAAVAAASASLTVIDHHKGSLPELVALAMANNMAQTAALLRLTWELARDLSGPERAELLREYPRDETGKVHIVFALTRAACELAFEYSQAVLFRTRGVDDTVAWPEVPYLYGHVAARDVGYPARSPPHSRAANELIFHRRLTADFLVLDRHTRPGFQFRPDELAEGARLVALREKEAAAVASAARIVALTAGADADTQRTVFAYAVATSMDASAVCDALMPGAPEDVLFVFTYRYDEARGQMRCNARTTRADVDLSVLVPALRGICEGGGHPPAAGFRVTGRTLLPLLYDSSEAAAAMLRDTATRNPHHLKKTQAARA